MHTCMRGQDTERWLSWSWAINTHQHLFLLHSLRVCAGAECVVSTQRGAVVLCVAMVDWPRSLLHSRGRVRRLPSCLSTHHSSLTAFKLTPPPDRAGRWCRQTEMEKETALRNPISAVERDEGAWMHSRPHKDLYVVAVLTSTAALGSIIPRKDRKGGASVAAC